MSGNFVSYDRDTLFLMPPSVQEWLPEHHLARFVVDIVAQLDLRPLRESYAGCGSAAYHPEMLTALLFYAYAMGIRASRKIEAATFDSVAFRYIAANQHPDHHTIGAFRRRFLPYLDSLFSQILVIAKEMNCLRIGTVSLDGTKIKASASKHRALSIRGIENQEQRIKREVKRMLELAEEADREDEATDAATDLPAEIQCREDRLRILAEVKQRIAQREKERIALEQAEHDEILAERRRIAEKNGKRFDTKAPARPKKKHKKQAQLNLTDGESRIMPSSEGFIQGYNAQIAVDTDSMLIVATDLSQRPTDRRLLRPMLEKLSNLKVGVPSALLADAGYFSELNIEYCAEKNILPYIPPERDKHYWGLRRFRIPKKLKDNVSNLKKMLYRLRTAQGQATYALRKCTVEPVFGILKRSLGMRQFHLRGKTKAAGEFQLGCTAWNMRKLYNMIPKAAAVLG